MKNIKKILKQFGITQKEFATKIELSRPTLDAYIQLFETGGEIPKEKYKIIFNNLFEKEYSREEFLYELDDVVSLLERDKRYGTVELSPEASDYVSSIMNQMRKDLRTSDWDENVYRFMNLLIGSYRDNKILKELTYYFTYLNAVRELSKIEEKQIVYLANFYRMFDELLCNPSKYSDEDYNAFLNRCQKIREEKENRQKEKKDELKLHIQKMICDYEKMGIELSKEDIVEILKEEIIDKAQNS